MTKVPDAVSVLAELGFPKPLASPSTLLTELHAFSPLKFCAFVMCVERSLDTPFPADLLDVLVTVEDLDAFAQVKASH